MELKKLFEPINIGPIRSKNRLVMSPMGTNYADKQGMVTPRQIAYYAERAKGGVGMITTEVTGVLPNVNTIVNELGVYSDGCIPGLTTLARTINECDCRSVLQLHHAGRRAASISNNGVIPKAPSPIACVGAETPQELTTAEIETIVKCFADAALRARKAGFDAVELHGGHGYLITQFLSPLSNKRNDKYGGSPENRTRFAIEIVAQIKDKAGKDYPILCKLSADEFLPGGLTTDDTKIIARKLQDAGVSALTATAGHTGAAPEGEGVTVLGASFPRGCMVHLAQALKEAVSIPVGAVSRINDPLLAETILNENKADLIYMGRALLADPEFPVKTMRGDLEEIRTCIGCSMCNKTLIAEPPNLSCSINAALGREREFQVVPAAKAEVVLVVGGGPGGIEAARVAALRGHKVSLYEKSEKLGGQLLLASIPPHKDEVPNLVRYLTTQLDKLGVNVEVNTEATAETIKQLNPDAIILATGSVPSIPKIPGVDGDNVFLAEDVLNGTALLKDTSVAIVGGGIVGCETAEYLAVAGKKVTIIEMLPEIGGDVQVTAKVLLEKRLREYGANIFVNANVKQIDSEAIVLEDGSEIKVGEIVLAVGRSSDRILAESLKGLKKAVYTIGDCQKPGMIIDATREGAEVGNKI
ncbi:FAD-dependent oxidoreductase [Chloroflexota bacterium]